MHLRTLNIANTSVTDTGLTQLAGLKSLRELRLSNTKITAEGLKELGPLKNLTTLCLFETPANDGSLRGLAGLSKLTTLQVTASDEHLRDLREIGLLHALSCASRADGSRPKSAEEVTKLTLGNITNAGLNVLVVLKNLSELTIEESATVTEAGIIELSKSLPKCRIKWGKTGTIFSRD